MKFERRVRIAMGAAAIFLGSALSARAGDALSPASLIARLSADAGADRDAAERELLAMGVNARAAVRAAMNTAEDPEVVMRLTRLWGHLRWQVLPRFTSDDAENLQRALGTEDPATPWQKAMDVHGADLVRVIIEMQNSPGQTASALRSMGFLLQRFPPVDVARAIALGMREQDGESYRALLRSATESSMDVALLSRLAEVEVYLWMYPEAFETSRAAYRRGNEDAVATAVDALRRGGLEEEIPRRLEAWAAPNQGATDGRDALFLVRIAQAMKRPEWVRGRLSSLSAGSCDPKSHAEIIRSCIGLQLREDAERILARPPRTATTVYLLSRVKIGDGKDDDARRIRAEAVELAEKDEAPDAALYQLAETAEFFGESAEDVWATLLKTAPRDSVYGANAALRLARLYDVKGDTDRALELYERVRGFAGTSDAGVILNAPGKSAWNGRAWLDEKIRELRARSRKAAPVEPQGSAFPPSLPREPEAPSIRP